MKLIDFVVTGSGFIFLLALCFFARNKFAPLVFFMLLLAWGTLVFLLQLFGAGKFSTLIASGFSVAVHILIAVAVGFILRKIFNRLAR